MKNIQPTSAIKDEFNPETVDYSNGLMGFHKIDGVRASHLIGFFHGRSMDPFKNPALNAKFADPVYAGFDGELTIDGLLTDETLDGETLCSLTTGLTNRSKLKKGEDALPDNGFWNLFDYLHPMSVNKPYIERYADLDAWLAQVGPDHVRLLPFVWINSPQEALDWIDNCIALGYEGAIFRDPKAMHKSGRAVASKNDFWRYKPVSDKDAICVGFEEAETNNNEATTNSRGRTERSAHKENKVGNGMVGTILGIDVKSGKPFRCGPGKMKHDFRIAAFENNALLVGQPFKYASLDTGVKDEPRQARFITLRSLQDMTPEDRAALKKWQEEND